MKTMIQQIAAELKISEAQVSSTVSLLDGGATVPFVARYRKEVTGGLDDDQLRTLEERMLYIRELDKRKATILNSIIEQGKLTDQIKTRIESITTKAELENVYRPFKPKRRTKAQIAREAGIQPLADRLLLDPSQSPEKLALQFLKPENGFTTVQEVLDGAKNILTEDFSETPDLISSLLQYLWNTGVVTSTVIKSKAEEGKKFSDYFSYHETIRTIPSHRALAVFRGKEEGILRVSLKLTADKNDLPQATTDMENRIAEFFNIAYGKRAADSWLIECVQEAWRSKILPHLETELMGRLKEQAENEAIRVFSKNLRDLLLTAPAGERVTLGLDPGFRTGVKLAVVDGTGQVVHTDVIYPHAPQKQWSKSIETLCHIVRLYCVELISIGNGTASRETDQLVQCLMKECHDLSLSKITVSEAGASVYSASKLASAELPDMDVSLRGAVSIARRLQDPLAELVKIEPKAIGVGQYQHDVNQTKLARMLETVVQDCVNAVGVDVNTASPTLLSYVSGLSKTLANTIVEVRNKNGPFDSRRALKKVPKLGPKAFEQAAGFLRIVNGQNPLDASAVHPEAYPIVQQILSELEDSFSIKEVIGNSALLARVNPSRFVSPAFGLPTIQDILAELEKPGRDPRPEFKTAVFKEGIASLSDLATGMKLEGVVTNITNFGAFVDIGVHQDGLVHISMMSDRFTKDPHTLVKTGQVVQVTVIEVDIPRKRIALSMRTRT